MKTILVFGHFDLEGGRSWVIRTGLIENGYTLQFCRTEAKGILRKYKELRQNWRKMSKMADAIYVPFLGHWVLPLAWLLARRRLIPIIFDAFLSLYDTEVCDRRRVSRFSPKARFLRFTDWLCCRLCSVVLVDTEEHRRYFVQQYGVDPKRILSLPIGCRTDLFVPLQDSNPTDTFTIEFHGTFIPLQGIETILHAAKIFQDQREPAHFLLIGRGQTFSVMQKLADKLNLKNVEFTGTIPMNKLPSLIAHADVCLGIFGTTAKAGRVIPNKAYEILNCGKPLVTARTTTSLQTFRDGINALLVNPGDPQDLAKKLLQLKKNLELRRMIARKGRELSVEKFQPGEIVGALVEWMQKKLRSP